MCRQRWKWFVVAKDPQSHHDSIICMYAFTMTTWWCVCAVMQWQGVRTHLSDWEEFLWVANLDPYPGPGKVSEGGTMSVSVVFYFPLPQPNDPRHFFLFHPWREGWGLLLFFHVFFWDQRVPRGSNENSILECFNTRSPVMRMCVFMVFVFVVFFNALMHFCFGCFNLAFSGQNIFPWFFWNLFCHEISK